MRNRAGQTLIEVLVATLVAAMTATAVFSVVLSSSVSGGRSDRKEAASMAINAVAEQLKPYVSVEPTNAAYSPNSGVWSGETSGLWALRAGNHTVTSAFLAGIPELSGRNPSMTYTVTNSNCGFGTGGAGTTGDALSCKRVNFTLTYDD